MTTTYMDGIRRECAEGILRYTLLITQAQLDRVRDFNGRDARNAHDTARNIPLRPNLIGANVDAVEVVPQDDPHVDMISGQWFNITIGILPDGSAHS